MPKRMEGSREVGRHDGVLARGDADLVAFARLFISNPDIPRRLARVMDGALPITARAERLKER